MAHVGRSQSFDNLLTISSLNNSELITSNVWKPRSGISSSVESLESGYDTVDGPKPVGRDKGEVHFGGVKEAPKKEKRNIKTVCGKFFKKDCAFKIFVIILFVIIVVSIPLIWYFYNAQGLKVDLGRKLSFLEKQRIVNVNRDGIALLSGSLGQKIPAGSLPHDCARGDKSEICLQWFTDALLMVRYVEYGDVLCYNIEWSAERDDLELVDCFDFGGSHWYGGPLTVDQKWPLDVENYKSMPYVTGSHLDDDDFGTVMERHWVSSRGVGIFANTENPLFISTNSSVQRLCLHSHYYNSPYRNKFELKPTLNYSVCSAPNSTAMTQFFIADRSPQPRLMPNLDAMESPSWTVPGDSVNETDLLSFAENVRKYDLPGQILDIGLRSQWDVRSGDFEVNPLRFPSGINLTARLAQHGFNLSLGVHPYVSVDAQAFQEGVNKNYFVLDGSADVPGLTKWWSGLGTALDVTNTEAVSWYVSRLRKVQNEYGINRFVFYGGQTSWLPHRPTFQQEFTNPDRYARLFVGVATNFNQSQVQVGIQTQGIPAFLRLEDHRSSWNALRALIPTVLTLSVHGYSYVNPGVIGGYTDIPGSLPDKELFIRWLQLATFLPIMQFSVPPWKYNSEVVQLAKTYTALHRDYVYPKITRLAGDQNPIIRPMWWVDPFEFTMLKVDDQFLIGDDLLVAPVVEKSLVSRYINLPFGVWKHVDSGKQFTGPKTLRDFKASLDKIPYFERVQL